MGWSARGFTLIEILVVVAILGIMVTAGVVSLTSGQGAARVRGAARDVIAAMRHARSVALVSQQPSTIAFSNESSGEGETIARVVVNSVQIINPNAVTRATTVEGEVVSLLEDEELDLVSIHKEGEESETTNSKAGEGIEDILFSQVSDDAMRGIKLKVLTGEEAESSAATQVTPVRLTRVSVFSTADYINSKYQQKVAAEKEKGKEKESEEASGESSDSEEDDAGTGPVSIVWEVNGRTEPHCVWIYRDGTKPEDGLLIRVDRFGAMKILRGDGVEDED